MQDRWKERNLFTVGGDERAATEVPQSSKNEDDVDDDEISALLPSFGMDTLAALTGVGASFRHSAIKDVQREALVSTGGLTAIQIGQVPRAKARVSSAELTQSMCTSQMASPCTHVG